MPPEIEWFANLTNPQTRRAYENAVKDFMRFAGIVRPEEFRIVTRAHVIAWRDELVRRGLGGSTIRHRLASLASLFEYLCGRNAVTHNPVKGVERPKAETTEGKTPAIGDHQARKLLAAPRPTRSRASATARSCRRCCSTRCGATSCASSRSGTSATRAKACRISRCPAKAARCVICRCIPAPMRSFTNILKRPGTARTMPARCSVRPQQPHRQAGRAITPDGIYRLVRAYSAALGFEIGAHALRATAATNALDHQADMPRFRSGSARVAAGDPVAR